MLLQLRGVERAAEDAERRGEHTLDQMTIIFSVTVAPISTLLLFESMYCKQNGHCFFSLTI